MSWPGWLVRVAMVVILPWWADRMPSSRRFHLSGAPSMVKPGTSLPHEALRRFFPWKPCQPEQSHITRGTTLTEYSPLVDGVAGFGMEILEAFKPRSRSLYVYEFRGYAASSDDHRGEVQLGSVR